MRIWPEQIYLVIDTLDEKNVIHSHLDKALSQISKPQSKGR